MNIELSVVIPVFNEETIFHELVERLQAVLKGLPFESEVILVDDGSSDCTP